MISIDQLKQTASLTFQVENKKHFKNIPITTTPTKCKIEETQIGGSVKTLINVFNRSSYSEQTECGTAESPAKRRRWDQWGEGH